MLALGAACAETHGTDDGGAGLDALASPCSSPTECVLTPASCCGTCGLPTPGDMLAVRTDQLEATRTAACGPGPIACPACAGQPDPYLLATCAAGSCAARNLHVESLTACSADADCTLAASTCCACGVIAMDAAIAFNPANGSLAALICDPRADCPPCVPTFTGLAAACSAGRCTVVAAP